jgi:hypothetical protein
MNKLGPFLRARLLSLLQYDDSAVELLEEQNTTDDTKQYDNRSSNDHYKGMITMIMYRNATLLARTRSVPEQNSFHHSTKYLLVFMNLFTAYRPICW